MKTFSKLLLVVMALVCVCVLLVSCGGSNTPPASTCTRHTYDDGVVTTAATCKADGVMTYTCTACGKSYTNTIKKLDHTYAEEGVVTLEPTCSKKGELSFICTTDGCTAARVEPIDKIAHDFEGAEYETTTHAHWQVCNVCGNDGPQWPHYYDSGVVTVVATCKSVGVLTKTCECGTQTTEEIPLTGHTWDEGVQTSAPSATTCEMGKILYTCTVDGCEATKEGAISATLQHTLTVYEYTVSSNVKQIRAECSVCQAMWTSQSYLFWNGAASHKGSDPAADIQWATKSNYTSAPAPAIKDGAYEILHNNVTDDPSNDQAQFYITQSRLDDFSAMNNTLSFFTISLKAPEAGVFESGFQVKILDDRTPNDYGVDRWSAGFAIVTPILTVNPDGTLLGANDAEGARVSLGALATDAFKTVAIAIELEADYIYFSYFVDGVYCGMAKEENTIASKAVNSLYLSGSTTKANTGIIFDNVTWSYANDGKTLPVNRHETHDWVAGETVAPSADTCAPGYTVYTCSICSAVKHDDFVDSSIAHTWDEESIHYVTYPVQGGEGVEAADGEWTITCSECGTVKTITGSFEDHDHAFDTSDTAATEYPCVVPGCEEKKQKEAAAE